MRRRRRTNTPLLRGRIERILPDLDHSSHVAGEVAALSTLARYAITGPLWLAAIGLSISWVPCGPPMMCCDHTPHVHLMLCVVTGISIQQQSDLQSAIRKACPYCCDTGTSRVAE